MIMDNDHDDNKVMTMTMIILLFPVKWGMILKVHILLKKKNNKRDKIGKKQMWITDKTKRNEDKCVNTGR